MAPGKNASVDTKQKRTASNTNKGQARPSKLTTQDESSTSAADLTPAERRALSRAQTMQKKRERNELRKRQCEAMRQRKKEKQLERAAAVEKSKNDADDREGPIGEKPAKSRAVAARKGRRIGATANAKGAPKPKGEKVVKATCAPGRKRKAPPDADEQLRASSKARRVRTSKPRESDTSDERTSSSSSSEPEAHFEPTRKGRIVPSTKTGTAPADDKKSARINKKDGKAQDQAIKRKRAAEVSSSSDSSGEDNDAQNVDDPERRENMGSTAPATDDDDDRGRSKDENTEGHSTKESTKSQSVPESASESAQGSSAEEESEETSQTDMSPVAPEETPFAQSQNIESHVEGVAQCDSGVQNSKAEGAGGDADDGQSDDEQMSQSDAENKAVKPPDNPESVNPCPTRPQTNQGLPPACDADGADEDFTSESDSDEGVADGEDDDESESA